MHVCTHEWMDESMSVGRKVRTSREEGRYGGMCVCIYLKICDTRNACVDVCLNNA